MWSGWRRRRPQFNIDVPLDEEALPAHPVRVEEQSDEARETVQRAKEKLMQAAGSQTMPLPADERAQEKAAAKEAPLLDDLVGKIAKSIMAPAPAGTSDWAELGRPPGWRESTACGAER